MRKITSVRVEYEDGTTAQYHGEGNAHVHSTEIKGESRRQPDRPLSWVSVSLLIKQKED
jgi:hypothetical protein